MPYLQSSWCALVPADSGGAAPAPSPSQASGGGNRTQRTVPHDQSYKGAPSSSGGEAPQTSKPENTRILCMRNIVRSQIEELNRSRPAQSTEDESFFRYTLVVDEVLFSGKFSNMYLSHHNDHVDFPLIGRVFEPNAHLDPIKSSYLKILKHLGRRHHSIVGTWDIFYDSNGRIVIFQEYAIHGNMFDYIRKNNLYVGESQMLEWAQQIYRGMDFLGDAGICHRSINPKHILLTPGDEGEKTLAKLGSFRDAIVYYDARSNRVRFQPCRPLDKRANGSFQAPEVFGSAHSEEYDPISADVWSYGATFFYAASRRYPYNYKANSPANIGQEIQKAIDMTKLSADAKRWFSGLLKADASRRTTFDKIETDPFYRAG